MEKTPVDQYTVVGYATTIAQNVNEMANALVPEVSGLLWQAGNLPLEKQVVLNEVLLGIQSMTLDLQQRVLDLLEYSKNLMAQEKVDAGQPAGLFVSLRQVDLPETQKAVYNDLLDQLELLLKTHSKIYTVEDVAALRLQDPQPVKVDLDSL